MYGTLKYLGFDHSDDFERRKTSDLIIKTYKDDQQH